MDKEFLNKVVDQIVNETRIDREISRITTPFLMYVSSPYLSYTSFSTPLIFKNHCKNVYGLNKEEIDYVWSEYKRIIEVMLVYPQ